jgi:hypothetical protein
MSGQMTFPPKDNGGSTEQVGVKVDKEQAEMAVKELRLFISLYEGAELPPESRIARHLEAARRAVAGYDAVERTPSARSA